MSNNDTVRQHYIPQFILRNFVGDEDKIAVFDKSVDKVFRSTPNNIAFGNYFYNSTLKVGNEEGNITLEQGFSAVESLAAPIFKQIRETRKLKISDNEKNILAEFLWLQFTRTKCMRELAKNSLPDMQDKSNIDNATNLYSIMDVNNLSENDIKNIHSLFIVDSNSFSEYFFSLQWVLVSTEYKVFFLADHPVSMLNRLNSAEKIGRDILGTEFYFPITPQLMLKMIDNKTIDYLKNNLEKLNELIYFSTDEVTKYLKCLDDGGTVICSDNEVNLLNYAQVINAERFVFSCNDDFDSAKKFLENHPEYKNPPNLTIVR